ncbi:RNA-binding ASCH domain protein [Euphorbia peplus]|nr:RNA-binding ASCH domain protein [Euphorbia peplus]
MEQPCSPGWSSVELRDCIEELIHLTLRSHLNHSLNFELGLSHEFCSYLLHHHQNFSHSGDSLPHPPLYKHLASVLGEYITCGSFNEENDLKERGMFDVLVRDEGTTLINILKSVNFELHVQEPYFTQLKDGVKTVEGRCAVGDYNRIGPGALILINKCLLLKVEDIHCYASFFEMLEAESLEKVLPGIETIDEGVKVYRKFYSEEKERANGVCAICVVQPEIQPCIPLARILSGLSYKGIEGLLGHSSSRRNNAS